MPKGDPTYCPVCHEQVTDGDHWHMTQTDSGEPMGWRWLPAGVEPS